MVLSSFAAIASGQIQIILSSSNVIGGSGHYDWSNWNQAGTYDSFNVVDAQTGPLSEAVGVDNYWLGRQAALNQYFVLDLGQAYSLAQIELFNTHNNVIDDRGTQNFTIYAANATFLVSASAGYNLSGATQILSGTLLREYTASDPLDAQTYTSANGLNAATAYRYLRFTAVDFYGVQGGGLNEIRIYAVPEPSTWALALGACAGIAVMWLRRRQLGR